MILHRILIQIEIFHKGTIKVLHIQAMFMYRREGYNRNVFSGTFFLKNCDRAPRRSSLSYRGVIFDCQVAGFQNQ